MTQQIRLQVYNKYGGRCAYCGRKIELKDMQVDHIWPQHMMKLIDAEKMNGIENLNPSCYRCNHYKRGESLEHFRQLMKTLHERVKKIYICKVAEDYGIIKVEPWNGRFYYEKEMGE